MQGHRSGLRTGQGIALGWGLGRASLRAEDWAGLGECGGANGGEGVREA